MEEVLPQTQVLLWIAGEQLRATLDNVILAAYHCRYDWRDRQGQRDPRGDLLSHTLRLPTGKAHPPDAPGLRGGVSHQAAQALGLPAPLPATGLALRGRPDWRRSALFRTGVKDVVTRFAPTAGVAPTAHHPPARAHDPMAPRDVIGMNSPVQATCYCRGGIP